ncbi:MULTISPECIES: UPF0149 family protein [Pseudoalteromonas]|uniref:YecA family protein n=1 Tax=Pseudoalteromonas aurantia 208 TaxID=1314867 RepID=A0ABR9EFM0_9GAMM|nr:MULTISPECIES: UPF0149 family protein [Pseudoalteromonas]MBE0369788.1 hypothetical protein [Pseudoalteromonas aurantia 208]MBQ4844752.1 UPF0149 family protein [Pseudoalteromonas sp. MMG005]
MDGIDFKYTAQQQAVLNQYFSTRDTAFNLEQVAGYFFAQICSPDATEVEQWMKVITAEDDAISEDVVFALMALHHDISEQVYSDCFCLKWHEDTHYLDCQQWSRGFLLGVTPYYERLIHTQEVSEELKQALQMSTEQLSFFTLEESQVKTYCQQTNTDMTLFIQQQMQLAGEFAGGYAQLIEATAISSGLYDSENDF